MKNRTILGIERIDEFKSVFENKRIGLITNPTGIDSNFKSSIDILREKTNLVECIFEVQLIPTLYDRLNLWTYM